MSKGPILSCGWCDEWQQCGVRPSADDCRTPESCPLRAQVVAAFAAEHLRAIREARHDIGPEFLDGGRVRRLEEVK